MKYRIAVIENKLFEPLYANSGEKFSLIKTTDENVGKLLLRKQVELGLLTPLEFAKIAKNGDWRIIPTTVLATKGYAELITLTFKQNLKSIDSIYFENSNNYLKAIIEILLAEKFDIHTKITSDACNYEDFDAYVSYFANQAGDYTIDISEEWFDTFEFPLPIAFWVTIGEIEDKELINITNTIKDELLNKSESIDEYTESTKYQARKGEILWQWTDEIEEAIDKTMDLMFYHHIIDDIPDTKIFGRDYSDES